jgi:Tube Death domain
MGWKCGNQKVFFRACWVNFVFCNFYTGITCVTFTPRLIEEEAKRQKKSAFDILIDEWGTSGKQRPTVCELVKLLAKQELYQAADYLSKELLGNCPVERPANGPSANIPSNTEDINFLQTTSHLIQEPIVEAANEHINQRFIEKRMSFPLPAVDEFNTTLPHLFYADLEYLTNDFDLNPVFQGRKLGKRFYYEILSYFCV